MAIYKRFQDWRVRLYASLRTIETAYLQALADDMQQALERINKELERRSS